MKTKEKSSNLDVLVKSIGEERFKFNQKLKDYTFSKSEGDAECFYIATTTRELTKVLDCCFDLNISYFIIGSGTKILISSEIRGLTIKNRTSLLKMAGMKGKIGKEGLGIEEAFIEADSGVSLKRLNEYVKDQKLKPIDGFSSLSSTIGGSIYLDPLLREATQSLRVWEEGEELEVKLPELRREHTVLSVIFKFKAV